VQREDGGALIQAPEWRLVEVIDPKRAARPSRDGSPWSSRHTRAERNRSSSGSRPSRARTPEHAGRELLPGHLRSQGLPPQKVDGLAALLGSDTARMGFARTEELYIELRRGAEGSRQRSSPRRSCSASSRANRPTASPAAADIMCTGRSRRSPRVLLSAYGIRFQGDRRLECCGGQVLPRCRANRSVGYISIGRGITIHRQDCPNAPARCAGTRALNQRWPGTARARRPSSSAPRRRGDRPQPLGGHLADLRRGRASTSRGALRGLRQCGNRLVLEGGTPRRSTARSAACETSTPYSKRSPWGWGWGGGGGGRRAAALAEGRLFRSR